MQAIAHGWKPKNKKNAPSREVAKKWVADIPDNKFKHLSAHLRRGR